MIPLGVFYLDNYVSSTFILCLPSQGMNFSTTWLFPLRMVILTIFPRQRSPSISVSEGSQGCVKVRAWVLTPHPVGGCGMVLGIPMSLPPSCQRELNIKQQIKIP